MVDTQIIVKTKATARGEEEPIQLKMTLCSTMSQLRHEVWAYCHEMDANGDFNEDIMGTCKMNVVFDDRKIGTIRTCDNDLTIKQFMEKYKLETFGDWFLQLPMNVDFGGGKRVFLTKPH